MEAAGDVISNLIRDKIISGQWRLTLHALRQCKERDIRVADVVVALAQGEVVEDYPDDPRGHSCPVVGQSRGRYFHVVCGIHFEDLVIITVYVPEPPKWADPWTRGKGDRE